MGNGEGLKGSVDKLLEQATFLFGRSEQSSILVAASE
jgi:hypothetical protein